MPTSTEGRGSGMRLDGDLYQCFWLRHGRFFRIEDHLTLDGALHALGLEGETLEAAGLAGHNAHNHPDRGTAAAMSHENVEIVRQGFDVWEAAWSSGTDDLSALLAIFDDDLVTRRLAPMPDPGIWHGVEGMLAVLGEWTDTFDEFTMKGEEYIDAGDEVVVRVAQEGRGDDSGVPVTGTFWFVLGVRDRKIVALDMYATREEALEAVGIKE